jgi:hypothetical protein
MFLLTGSQALCHRTWSKSNPKSDWDFIASESDLNKIGLSFNGKDSIKAFDNVEFINRDLLNNDKLVGDVEVLPFNHNEKFIFLYHIATLEELYIQKRSHLFRPIKFARHIQELQKIKECGLELNDREESLLKERIRLTKEKFGDRTPSLNKSNDEFFDDYVTKYYVHDDIHRAVAYYDQPIYEKLKLNYDQAKCEKLLWDQLSYYDKVKCVQEECFVIALERFIIPKLVKNEKHMPIKFAFFLALEKVCTTLTSGWFRDFAIDNWKDITNYDVDFLTKFEEAKCTIVK